MAPMNEQRPGVSIVLVVEDDPILMMALVGFVEDAGCEAVEVDSIADAIEILETRTDIRTVFTDLDMRGSPAGLRMMVAIRDRWPPIELLMVTSQLVRVDELPPRGVLVGKPFDSRKIVATLKRMAA